MMIKQFAKTLVILAISPLLVSPAGQADVTYSYLPPRNGSEKSALSIQCIWNGNTYNPGDHFCNEALQQWVCNEDGSYSFTGQSGTDVCKGMAATCIWDGKSYQTGDKFCNSALQQWACDSDGSYHFTGNTGVEYCSDITVQCTWDGRSYRPGEYFCNSDNQQWQCKADGSYVYTGNSGEEYCNGVASGCALNGVNYKTGDRFCDSSCQQWVCQASGTFIYTGYSGKDVCPTCVIPTAVIPHPTQTPVNTATGCQFSYQSENEIQVLNLINQLRENAGLPKLTLNDKLSTAARIHSQDMACNDYFSHSGSDGLSPYDRITAQGYSYSSAGENIAGGNSTPEAIVDGWLNSEGHKRNMLSQNYREIGIGYVYQANSTYGGYWTTNFGYPK